MGGLFTDGSNRNFNEFYNSPPNLPALEKKRCISGEKQTDCFWTDAPITSTDQDRLGYTRIAKGIFDKITSIKSGTESAVFAITASWGAGKSSVLNLVENEFGSTELQTDWKIVRFTPWAAGDEKQLLHEFYNCLATALPERKFKKLKKSFKKLLELSMPLIGVIPNIGKAIQETFEYFIKYKEGQKTWDDLFKLIARELKEEHRQILVIADDIDRLDISELSMLLKLLRLLGKMPNVHYLLCFDEVALVNTLASGMAQDVNAARIYLDKFVQHQINLPEIMPHQIWFLLDDQLKSVFSNTDHLYDEGRQKLVACQSEIIHKLSTPRAIGRLAATLRFLIPLHKPGEILVEDLILITLISCTNKSLYRKLYLSKSVLCGKKSYGDDTNPAIGKIKDLARGDSLSNVIQALFPRLMDMETGEGGEGLSISNNLYFYRYFHQGISDIDISDDEFNASIREISCGNFQHADMYLSCPENSILPETYIDKVENLVNGDVLEVDKSLWNFEVFKYFALKTQHFVDSDRYLHLSGQIGRICRRIWYLGGISAQMNDVFDELIDLFDELPYRAAAELFDCLAYRHRKFSGVNGANNANSTLWMKLEAHVCERVLGEVIVHIKLGDKADIKIPVFEDLNFLYLRYLTPTQKKFKSLYDCGALKCDDYLARFVKFERFDFDKRYRLLGFSIREFEELTMFCDPVFQKIGGGDVVDDYYNDVSWQGRKIYSQSIINKGMIEEWYNSQNLG